MAHHSNYWSCTPFADWLRGTKKLSVETNDVAEVRGALTLYMDFINLFINLLQLFGDRK
jgi:FtsH-binding integral membrane protein